MTAGVPQRECYSPPPGPAPAPAPLRSTPPAPVQQDLFPIELFYARFPEFGNESANIVYFAIREACNMTPTSVWGNRQEDGAMYLAAHLLASRNSAVASIANINTTPAAGTLGMGYDATLYGQEYKRIQSTLAISGFTI